MKELVRSSVWALDFDTKHQKKAEVCVDRYVNITMKMKTTVQIL